MFFDLHQDAAVNASFVSFKPDAVFIDAMFPPAALLSPLLGGVPLIAIATAPIPPMEEVFFGIQEPADEVSGHHVEVP